MKKNISNTADFLDKLSTGYIILKNDINIIEINKTAKNLLNIDTPVSNNSPISIKQFSFKANTGILFYEINSSQFIESLKNSSASNSIYLVKNLQNKKESWLSFKYYNPGDSEKEVTHLLINDSNTLKQQEIHLNNRLDIENIVTEISTRFVNVTIDNYDFETNRALAKIGHYTGIDRCYVFKFKMEYQLMTNTHEWCAEGINPEIENLKDLPTEVFGWWNKTILQNKVIYLASIEDIPNEEGAEELYNLLVAQSIQSLLVVPISAQQKVIGFIGFDSVKKTKKWNDSDIRLLRLVAEIFGNAKMNIESAQKINEQNLQLETLLNQRTLEKQEIETINKAIIKTSGVLIMSTKPNGLVESYNPMAESILKYTAAEVIDKFQVTDWLHPQDKEKLIISSEKHSGSKFEREGLALSYFVEYISNSFECTLIAKDGSLKPFLLTVNIIKDRNNRIKRYVAIGIDISNQKVAENRLVSTLAQHSTLVKNMKSGVLFESAERNVILSNNAFCKIFDIPVDADQIKGKNSAQRVSQYPHVYENINEIQTRIDQIIKQGKAVKEDLITLKNGKIISRDYTPIKLSKNEIGHFWQFSDVTEEKAQEKYNKIEQELGFELAPLIDIESVAIKVNNAIRKINAIKSSCVYIFDAEANKLVFVHSTFTNKEKKYCNQVQKSLNKHHLKYNQVEELIIDFTKEQDHKLKSAYPPFKNIHIIPINYGNKLVGALLVSYSNLEQLGVNDRYFLKNISNQIGGVIKRIEIQTELSQSQRDLYLMFNSIDEIIFVFNHKLDIIEANKAFLNKANYTENQIINKNLKDFFTKKDKKTFKQYLKNINPDSPKILNVDLQNNQDESFPIEVIIIESVWKDRKVFIGTARDISEQLKHQKELETSEARWQFALESSGDGIWDWNLKTNKVFFSSQWKKMIGIENKEIESNILEMENRIHPEDIHRVKKLFYDHIEGKTEIYESDHRIRTKSGAYIWILDRGKIIERDKNGNPLRLIGTHTNISKRKEFENSLKISLEKEKELNKLKSQFVSMTSHELRTPLASMLMSVELILHYFDRLKKSEIKSKISDIETNIQSFTKIIDKVLNLSNIEMGKTTFDPKLTALNSFIDETLQTYTENNKIKHALNITKSEQELWINVDQQMFVQIIINLIQNAVKYTPNDLNIYLKTYQSDNYAAFEVKDFGLGIKQNEQENIFKPYQRGSNVENIKGTGIGLVIVDNFVKTNRGKIKLISEINKGTSFTVKFPLVNSL